MISLPQTVHFGANRISFPVTTGRGLFLGRDSPSRTDLFGNRRLRIIVDRQAAVSHPKKMQSLRGLLEDDRDLLVLGGGERAKSLGTLSRILRWLDSRKVGRRSECLVIVGGGAVSDVASLAASMYRRGISFARIPTTPLAMVDAGVGLKSAINLDGRKNLVGAFSPPVSVYSDVDWLASVPRRHLVAGMAEILKIGLALDSKVYGALVERGPAILAKKFQDPGGIHLLARSARAMVSHLEQDPFELLGPSPTDLGHTLSRYLEQVVRPRLTHGEAVAIEIAWCVRYARRVGVLGASRHDEILALMTRLGLLARSPVIDLSLLRRAADDIQRHRDGARLIFVPCDEGVTAVPLEIGVDIERLPGP